ncbi:hypothetical protein K1719_020249 [Acacia pycnantha]|nr:hypothetical protein K1719_020249 [Acacia pycnantha]
MINCKKMSYLFWRQFIGKISSNSRRKGLRCFQLQRHIAVLDASGTTAKLNSSNEHKTASSNTDEFSFSFKVEYLPPIILTCLLPGPQAIKLFPRVLFKWEECEQIIHLILSKFIRRQPGRSDSEWIDSQKHHNGQSEIQLFIKKKNSSRAYFIRQQAGRPSWLKCLREIDIVLPLEHWYYSKEKNVAVSVFLSSSSLGRRISNVFKG